MELRHLKYFVAVAEELNFTRAAERLRTAQPSLSQQIRDLELEIGTPLLERTKRRVELTPAGQAFLDEARLALAQAHRAIVSARRAAKIEGESLKIGFIPSAEVKIFPHVLSLLRMRMPDLNVLLHSVLTPEQEACLLDGRIDVGFMRSPVLDKSLVYEKVLTESLVAVVAASHPLARMEHIDVALLEQYPCIMPGARHAGSLHNLIWDVFRQYEVEPPEIVEAENVLMAMTLTATGQGVCLLPDYVEALLFRNVVARPLSGVKHDIDLLMVWREDHSSTALSAFLELVRGVSGQYK